MCVGRWKKVPHERIDQHEWSQRMSLSWDWDDGDDDESVPATDTRQLAEAHGAAEMRVLEGAGHRMRHDPRAMAVLFGWLDRQRLDGE